MIKQILFAEDEDMILEVAEKRLRRDGFEVHPAHNGNEAYDLAVKHVPDLIVTDVVMPGMNGFEFCKALKANVQTKEIPIIVLSAKFNMEDSFYYIGVKDFLRKPFQFEDLEQRINRQLRMASLRVRNKKILFHCSVESTMAMAKVLLESVKEWSPMFANTGRELLSQVHDFVPDLIVIDLFMKDAHADEVIMELRKMPALRHTEILTYYSPFNVDENELSRKAKMIEVQYSKTASIEAGAKDYLGPFHPEHFIGLCSEYCKEQAE